MELSFWSWQKITSHAINLSYHNILRNSSSDSMFWVYKPYPAKLEVKHQSLVFFDASQYRVEQAIRLEQVIQETF